MPFKDPLDKKAWQRNYHLKKNYDLTTEEYDFMWDKQKGRCACCRRKGLKLGVDHDHNTKEVRELLCDKCNNMISRANDSIKRLLDGIIYLMRHKKCARFTWRGLSVALIMLVLLIGVIM